MRSSPDQISTDVHRGAESLAMLLFLSGFFGAVFGTISATWQAPMETAQVLVGVVTYPETSVAYAYHMSAISMINYMGALFLLLTRSEVASSVLLSIAIGVVSMQVVAMLVFISARNAYLATLAALLIAVLHLHGGGISYPLILFGSPHGGGRAGMAFALLVALMVGFSRWRAAFFLAGLSLIVHLSWGLWVNACLVVALALHYREVKTYMTRSSLKAYALGAAISLFVFALHKIVFGDVSPPSAVSPNGEEMFLHYIRYWDYHRAPFTNPVTLAREFLQVGVAIIAAVVLQRQSRGDTGVRVFATTILVAAVLGTVFVFVPSWFDPALFPKIFVVLMPSRFINFVLMVGFPLLVGLLLRRVTSLWNLILISLAWAVTMQIVSHSPRKLPLGDYHSSLLLLAVLVAAWSWFGKRHVPKAVEYRTNAAFFSILTAVLLFTPLLISRSAGEMRASFATIDFPRGFDGTVLTTMDRYLFQIESRQRTITPNLDGYIYSGRPLDAVQPLLNDVYAIPFGQVPPDSIMHGRSTNALFSGVWEERNCTQWAELGARFGFQAILVPGAINLRLKKVNHDPRWNVYYPQCASIPR